MIRFTAVLTKFAEHGEKTGWTVIVVPAAIAEKIKPGTRKSYRVKGFIDAHPIEQVALVPMGEGEFILAVNTPMRNAIGKRKGATVKVQLEEDKVGYVMNADLMACLEDEPKAIKFFQTLAPGHQRYFSKWIESAKTAETRAKRIAQTVNAALKSMGYPEMIRALKAEKDKY